MDVASRRPLQNAMVYVFLLASHARATMRLEFKIIKTFSDILINIKSNWINQKFAENHNKT